jgi:hypothetical protein
LDEIEPIQSEVAVRPEVVPVPQPALEPERSVTSIAVESLRSIPGLKNNEVFTTEVSKERNRGEILTPASHLLQRRMNEASYSPLVSRLIRLGSTARSSGDIQIGYGNLFFDDESTDDARNRISRNAPGCAYLQISFSF